MTNPFKKQLNILGMLISILIHIILTNMTIDRCMNSTNKSRKYLVFLALTFGVDETILLVHHWPNVGAIVSCVCFTIVY